MAIDAVLGIKLFVRSFVNVIIKIKNLLYEDNQE